MKKFWIYLLVMTNVILAQDIPGIDSRRSYGPQEIEEAHYPAGVAAVVAELEEYRIPSNYLLDLVEMKKLPFPVYSWPIDAATLNKNNFMFLVEYVRITGSLGINEFITNEQLTLVMQIIAQANGKLVLNASPFHRYGCDRNPDNWEHTNKDIQLIQDYLTKFKHFPVAAILFDSECYNEPHPNVTARLNLVFDVAKGIMPDVPIFWYRNGDWPPNLEAKRENRTVGWYRPYNYLYTEGWLIRWKEKTAGEFKNVAGGNGGYWTAWVTLGSGYGWEGFGGWRWDLGLDPLHYEYLGKECKELGGPVLLYPGAYRAKCPSFHQAFKAFVRGATETYEQGPTGVE